MRCSSPEVNERRVCYQPNTYYRFRCEVLNSVRQVWMVSGTEKFTLGLNSQAPSFDEESSMNFYAEKVTPGVSSASFVSYLWFNSSKHMEATNVTCASFTRNITIRLDPYGTYYHHIY